jgi:hypothetical protein
MYSGPRRVWLVTSRLGTGKPVTFFTVMHSMDILNTSGFWPRVRARELRAQVFLGSLPRQSGRCAPPPAHRSFAASYSTPKNIYNLSNLGRPRPGLLSFQWTTEAVIYKVPSPAPPVAALLILPAIFLGSNYVAKQCDHTP